MTSTRTQETTHIAIGTPLGDDALLLESFTSEEQLSRPFKINAVLSSEQRELDFAELLGQNVTIRVQRMDGEAEYLNGCVSRFAQVGVHESLSLYTAEIVPWLWFLTRTSDCRIWQQKKASEIVLELLGELGVADLDNRLAGSDPVREYCVQYRESAFDFISRLLEEEGFYYFFKHEDGKHTLVLAEAATNHEPVTGYETLPFKPANSPEPYGEGIVEWLPESAVQTGAIALTDFDFTNPAKGMAARRAGSATYPGGDFEAFDYPGRYTEPADGENYARYRLEALAAAHKIVRGRTDARGLAAGATFTLDGHPRADQNREYLVTALRRGVESRADGRRIYTASFEAIPSDVQFRAPAVTPKPVVRGPQTAIVVGRSGEEIDADEHGRVKVLFHWDRYAAGDEHSSCWVRVAQMFAGKSYGALHTPRIGQEVVVEFLEGDPDRPLITGRVYNGKNKPPYDPKTMPTISGLKSNSSKGGGGFNEIRFEDKKGEEQVFVHAEKNADVRVKNDTFEWIGNDRHLVVKKDQKEKVENDRHETVTRDHIEEVGRDFHLAVKGKQAIAVTGTRSLTVHDDVSDVYKKNHSEQVTDKYYLVADELVIEGKTHITIKVGDNFIAIESGGITIQTGSGPIEIKSDADTKIDAGANLEATAATNATVKGDSALALEGGSTAELKSPNSTVKGDSSLTVSGGTVMIN